jgi:hypothetical protein
MHDILYIKYVFQIFFSYCFPSEILCVQLINQNMALLYHNQINQPALVTAVTLLYFMLYEVAIVIKTCDLF